MKDNYIKILDSFNLNEYITTNEIKKTLIDSNHIEAIKIMKKHNIAEPYDYLRACGKSGFTDFALNKLEKITQDDSKYIISRNINGKVIYLCTNKISEKLEEMKFLVDKGYFNTIESNSMKIKGYFTEENEITIGKKSTGEMKILLDEANLNSIVTRKYYLFDKNHLSIQGQLGALGIYFGYKSKLARNDKNKELYGVNLNTVCIATIEDIDISNLKSQKSLEKIDYVDVIWIGENTNDLTVAIEVEFKKDWDDAILRLISVTAATKSPENVVNIIVSEKEEDFFQIKYSAQIDIFTLAQENFKLAHITTQRLIEILKMRDIGIDKELVRQSFYKQIKYI